MKKIIHQEFTVCDRCGEKTDVTNLITKSGYHVIFSTDAWEWIWDGKTYNFNVGSGGDKRQFEWLRLKRKIEIELCEKCWERFQKFWQVKQLTPKGKDYD